jgi:hypothetical protein
MGAVIVEPAVRHYRVLGTIEAASLKYVQSEIPAVPVFLAASHHAGSLYRLSDGGKTIALVEDLPGVRYRSPPLRYNIGQHCGRFTRCKIVDLACNNVSGLLTSTVGIHVKVCTEQGSESRL